MVIVRPGSSVGGVCAASGAANTSSAPGAARYGRRPLTMPAGIDTPTSFKIAGIVSIVSWLAVLYFGRMLPFIGEAF